MSRGRNEKVSDVFLIVILFGLFSFCCSIDEGSLASRIEGIFESGCFASSVMSMF